MAKVFPDVPELPGCKAHGNSYDEALTQIKEAITLWVDTAVEFGDSIPEAKGRRREFADGEVKVLDWEVE